MPDRVAIPKLAARRIGQLITVAALLFLTLALYRQWSNIIDWQPTVGQVALFAMLTLGYSAALMLLAYNWVTIVQTLMPQSPPRAVIFLSYTKTQIAKYVPGNIVHLVSRHMHLKHLGLDHRPLATASLLELVSLPFAAVIAICLAGSFIDDTSMGYRVFGTSGSLPPLFFFVAVGLSALVIWRTQRSWHLPATIVLFRAVGFMVCQGGIFAVVLYAVSGSFIAVAIPAAILAWLIGFLTPGAPGGLRCARRC
ncbi:hypothetical protein [Yoonia sp. MH D7]